MLPLLTSKESQANFFLGTFSKQSIKIRHIKFAPFYMVSDLHFRRSVFKVWISARPLKENRKLYSRSRRLSSQRRGLPQIPYVHV